MRYAFVSLSIIAIWISMLVLIIVTDYSSIVLPVIALVLTVIIFEIGVCSKK
ncbi:MAG: hypothetical protein K2G03_06240 [Bacilli bacterium]|nr:hypothetical protein [Bacilli bacterium]